MITIAESQILMKEYIELKDKYFLSNSRQNKVNFTRHQTLCFQKFKYLIDIRIAKYKLYSNYEDLSQEGNQALLKAMNTFDIDRGLFVSWAHKHIFTTISRKASQHSVIRVPMKVSRITPPYQDSVMPHLTEDKNFPDMEVEKYEIAKIIKKAMLKLNDNQKLITNLYFGLKSNDDLSINKIVLKTKMSRDVCIELLNQSIEILKNEVKI